MSVEPAQVAPAAPTNGDESTSRREVEARPVEFRGHGDRQNIIKLLNDALGTALASFVRYRQHHFASPGVGGIAGFALAVELLRHSEEKLSHADRLAARITQLGGQPDFRLPVAVAGVFPKAEAQTVRSMLTEDLGSARTALNSYATLVRIVGERDPTSRRLLEDLLAQEETQVQALEDFLRHVQGGV